MESVHDLTAAYALDALDDGERREYERHLSGCERCRDELAEFRETASALAFAVEAPAPSPELRDRILREIGANGAKVIPLRSRRPFQLTVGLAAAAACVAVALGVWATSLARSLERERDTRSHLAALLSDPEARTIRISPAGRSASDGKLVVDRDGDAALVVRDLSPAPSGKAYEIWVVARGGPKPAGLFDAREGREAVLLSRRVPKDGVVAVTLEREGGVDAPTRAPLLSAAT